MKCAISMKLSLPAVSGQKSNPLMLRLPLKMLILPSTRTTVCFLCVGVVSRAVFAAAFKQTGTQLQFAEFLIDRRVLVGVPELDSYAGGPVMNEKHGVTELSRHGHDGAHDHQLPDCSVVDDQRVIVFFVSFASANLLNCEMR